MANTEIEEIDDRRMSALTINDMISKGMFRTVPGENYEQVILQWDNTFQFVINRTDQSNTGYELMTLGPDLFEESWPYDNEAGVPEKQKTRDVTGLEINKLIKLLINTEGPVRIVD
jgi:hypothetical protein